VTEEEQSNHSNSTILLLLLLRSMQEDAPSGTLEVPRQNLFNLSLHAEDDVSPNTARELREGVLQALILFVFACGPLSKVSFLVVDCE
jgi:hypothetical protein